MTKKLSKEFSRTEFRILGALSKLDDFLLNPQVRTCYVAVQGTSGNANSENREPTGDRSLDDPCPEVRYSSDHSGNLNSPEVEDYPHSCRCFNSIGCLVWLELFFSSIALLPTVFSVLVTVPLFAIVYKRVSFSFPLQCP